MDSQRPSRRQFLGDLGRTAFMGWMGVEYLAALSAPEPAHAAGAPASTRRGILRLDLKADRLDEMRTFYADTLGFPVERAPGALIVETGETLIRFEEAEPGTAPYYHVAWAIPENKIEESKDWLTRRTPILTGPDGLEIFHFRYVNRHGFFFADPAGNILEFIARHDLKDGVSSPFRREHIFYVNHAGLVVDDMDEAIGQIRRDLGIELTQDPAPNFATLGDGHRHVTLVTRNRLWLPDRVKAADVHEAEIVMHGSPSRALEFERYPYRLAIES